MKKIIGCVLIISMTNLTHAQNVGINTNTPPFPFTVSTLSQGITQISADGSVKIGFWTSNSSAYLQTVSNHPLFFSTNNGQPQMVLSTAGTVGIGNITPDDAGLVVDKKIGAV